VSLDREVASALRSGSLPNLRNRKISIANLHSNIPLILLKSFGELAICKSVRQSLFADCVSKPIAKSQLLESVQYYVVMPDCQMARDGWI
jgi:hypothetical protein